MGKRILAIVAALAMIVGAMVYRSRSGGEHTASGAATNAASTVVCAPDFAEQCQAAASEAGLSVDVQPVNTTINGQAVPDAWVTITPLPAAAAFGTDVELNETPIATSTLTLVVLPDRAETLTTACTEPVDWNCVGGLAGSPWSEIDGPASWGNIRPGLSPTTTAIGAMSAGAAVSQYFAGASIDTSNPGFITWARTFARAVPAQNLSAGSAVGTIQVRASTLDIAVGAAAELAPGNGQRFSTLKVGEQTPLTVVVATAPGVAVPDGFVSALRDQLTEGGWGTVSDKTTTLSGAELRAAIAAWEEMQ